MECKINQPYPVLAKSLKNWFNLDSHNLLSEIHKEVNEIHHARYWSINLDELEPTQSDIVFKSSIGIHSPNSWKSTRSHPKPANHYLNCRHLYPHQKSPSRHQKIFQI